MNVSRLKLSMSNAYLVDGEGSQVLVDAGMRLDQRAILNHPALAPDRLQMILITHAHIDHYGAAAAIRKETGARVAIHRADVNALRQGASPLGQPRGLGRMMIAGAKILERFQPPGPCEPDLLLEEGDLINLPGLSVRVLHTPGHTHGSCTFLFESRFAFVGDLLSTTRGAHVQRYLAQDWAVLYDSIRRLQASNPDWLYPGHGRTPIRGGALPELADQARRIAVT